MLAWPSRNSCHLGKTSGVPDSVLAALRGLARSLLPTPRGGKQSVQHHFTDEKSGTECRRLVQSQLTSEKYSQNLNSRLP